MTLAKQVIKEFNESYLHNQSNRDLLFIQRLKNAKLKEEEIALVLTILEDTCKKCFDNIRSCNCTVDK